MNNENYIHAMKDALNKKRVQTNSQTQSQVE